MNRAGWWTLVVGSKYEVTCLLLAKIICLLALLFCTNWEWICVPVISDDNDVYDGSSLLPVLFEV